MSSFTEQLEADVKDVFINADEFAEVHIVNGMDVPCILEGLNTRDMLIKANNTPAFDGVNGMTRILHIKASDMPERVVCGNVIEVDSEIYRVGNVTEDIGLLTVTLEADSI